MIRHLVVHGRVQGVGYRAWTEHQALTRGLGGWVRNCQDGTVEAVLEGADAEVLGMIEACRRGPALARVDHVVVETAGEEMLRLRRPGELFSVLPTF